MKKYVYKGITYNSPEELLEVLVEDGMIDYITSTDYYFNDEYIGNDNVDGPEDIIQMFLDNNDEDVLVIED